MQVFIKEVEIDPVKMSVLEMENKRKEIMDKIESYKRTRQIFEKNECWDEVSKIQYEIDKLEKEVVDQFGEEFKLEPWFVLYLQKELFSILKAKNAQIIYIGKLAVEQCKKCPKQTECEDCAYKL